MLFFSMGRRSAHLKKFVESYLLGQDVALLYPDEASLELYVQTPEYGMPDPTR
jgi:hypothetical protein